jgi:hypothetical protein
VAHRWKIERSKARQTRNHELWVHYGLLVAWRRYLHNEALKNNELLKTMMKAGTKYKQDTPSLRKSEPPRASQSDRTSNTAPVTSAVMSEAIERLSSRLVQLDEKNTKQFNRLEEKQDRVLAELSKLMSRGAQGDGAPSARHGSLFGSSKPSKRGLLESKGNASSTSSTTPAEYNV